MIIKSLELLDYRNYHRLQMNFDRGTNILYGDNAQGKTIFWNLFMSVRRRSPTGGAGTEK